MATQPTNLPVPSESARDLKFNAGKIDEFVTSLALKYADRFGGEHYTIEGLRQLAQQAISAFGWVPMDSFQDGATLTLPNQVLRWKMPDGDGDYYRWDGAFPKVVPAASTPESTGGVGAGKWLSVGDAVLRTQISDPDGAKLVGYGNATLLDLANSVFVSDFSSALESRFPSSIKTMTIVKYHADSVGIFNLAHATNIMRRTSEIGTPGDTDGGSWLIDSNGVKWVTTLPLHVDRFGAFPSKAISSFDSGPAYQKAVKAAGLEGYGQRTTLLTGNYVYTIDSKVLLPSCVEIVGNGTTYVSHNLDDDFKFETAYFKDGVLTSNIYNLTDEQCIASAIVRNTSFIKSQFLGVKRCFNLRCFTMGCEISDVTFHDCGIAIYSIQGFYASYNVDIIGDYAEYAGSYAISLGRATNLVRCVANISSRTLGISLSEPYNSSFLQNNTQNVSFEGSSFETMDNNIR